jgi:hypothetical protein
MSDEKPKPTTGRTRRAAREERAERLALRLRENLRRRKQQTRARRKDEETPAGNRAGREPRG